VLEREDVSFLPEVGGVSACRKGTIFGEKRLISLVEDLGEKPVIPVDIF